MIPLGRINLTEFVNWCKSKEDLLESSIYTQDHGRLVVPLGYKLVNNKPPKVVKAHYDRRMDTLASRFCPDWRLSLLCRYDEGGGVTSHRDASIYGVKAYVISSVDYNFIIDGTLHNCKSGVLYEFNSKKLHSVPPVKSERWALIWWEQSKLWKGKFSDLVL